MQKSCTLKRTLFGDLNLKIGLTSCYFRLIFISHSSKDLTEVMQVINKFANLIGNVNLFLAHRDIHGGATWRNEILEKLASCGGVIAFISRNFKESNWTGQEIGYAIAKGKKVLSISIDSTSPYGFISEEESVNWKKNSFYDQSTNFRYPEYEFSTRRLLYSLMKIGFLPINRLIERLGECSSYLEAERLTIPLSENSNLIDKNTINSIGKVLLKAKRNNYNQVTESTGGSEALLQIFSEHLDDLSPNIGKELADRDFFEKIGNKRLGDGF